MSKADEQKHPLSYATGRLPNERRKPPFVTAWDLVVIGVLAFLAAALLGWIAYTRLFWGAM